MFAPALSHPILKQARRRTGQAVRSVLPGRAPDFLIIGAQKAGTTTLYQMLDSHPDLKGSWPKEIGYFSRDIHFGVPLSYYESHFKRHPFGPRKFFEATPEYLCWPGVAERIAAVYPDIKLIAILREPAARAYSAWSMYGRLWRRGYFSRAGRRRGASIPGNRLLELLMEGREEIRPFRECLEIELELIESGEAFEPALIRRGLYLDQLEAFWTHFHEDQLLILGFGELTCDPQSVFERVCRFVGVSPIEFEGEAPKANAGHYADPLAPEDRALLEEIYAEPNDALFKRTGALYW